MFEWNLKNICKNKLCKKDGNSVLGYCILKMRFFQLSLRKKVLKWSFLIKSIIEIHNTKKYKKSKIWCLKKKSRSQLSRQFAMKPCQSPKILFKANHLAYIEPMWYGSRISTDCQQKLLFTKHDTSGRFLLTTFLEKQKRGDGMQR